MKKSYNTPQPEQQLPTHTCIHASSSPCFDTPALTPDFCQLVAGLASWEI
ncbi:hypothetical protein ACRRTK_021987 [Alexandromys fortis]